MATCKTCSECTFLNLEKEESGKFRCDRDYSYHYANAPACSREVWAYSRDESLAKDAINKSKSHQSSGGICYLTTITCEILGLEDNNKYLQTLRRFRKEKLQKDDKYKEILVQYDIVGPIIAERLRYEERNNFIAKNLLTLGISKACESINQGNDLEAIRIYTTMTKLLIDGYKIEITPTDEQINNADINKSGHGVYVKTA